MNLVSSVRFRATFRHGSKRRVLVVVGLSSLVVGLPAGFAAAGQRPPAATAGRGCALPLTHDRYDGFHVGVPAGWNLFGFAGMIVVNKSAAGAEEAVVDPAVLGKGLTPTRFFLAVMHQLQAEIAAAGNAMT